MIVLFTFLAARSVGQEKVAVGGRVVRFGSGESLIGAQVAVKDSATPIRTLTVDDGIFSLQVDRGKYTLVVTYLGYEPKELVIDTDEWNSQVTIELATSSVSLNEIIVSESSKSYRSDFKGSNFRISPQEVTNSNPLGTEEILRFVPGVNIVGDMSLSNRPNISIRGSWGRRSEKVLMMEDGSPTAPAPYLAPGTYYNPVSDRVKAIEVYKGADMLRYGPNNMYGAVNYITALPPQKPELRLKLIGGNRNYTTGLLSYGGTWNNVGMLVEGVYKKFDGFLANSSVEMLNLNAKWFATLSKDQSLYFKVSSQFEDNLATLSAQTPLTFKLDPTSNPFDADRFTMRRYGLDIIHKWAVNHTVSLTSKVFASDFSRDWWRQNTSKVRADEALDYLGTSIYNGRYGYLSGRTFGEEDYLMVGRVVGGLESTANSKWTFSVVGLQETLAVGWGNKEEKHQLEVGLKYHRETYRDALIEAGSSRWARSGNPSADLDYYLWSVSSYARNVFRFGQWNVTPIVRFEYINMYRQDVLAVAGDPTIDRAEAKREYNDYPVVLPGVTLDYQLVKGEIFGSIYKGFIAPSKVFGFLVEQDGIITNPLVGQSINMKPEVSLNTEIGWRGGLVANSVDGQLTYFNNTVYNFFVGGRNEVFTKLGEINVQGVELALHVDLLHSAKQRLTWTGNATFLTSKVLSGELEDSDLFGQVIHNHATRQEFLNKINNHREAYALYTLNGQGEAKLDARETFTMDDFDGFTKSVVRLGDGGVKAEAPYTPKVSFSSGLYYDISPFAVGASGHYTGSQFTEFNNFVNESADGSIGKLSSFFTVDVFANYDLLINDRIHFHLFVNGKNITNNIYKASRLNRATGGIFPGGFRQWLVGINMDI
ncbi:Fe(3+) dicitrate transport protein [Parapedobacter koreensis]|uniref:Fe(3+) dicitrate transport protein n=2 Tax=Parapedobacter koreensis TaxID=332977 RepID=A0A1H7TDH3_9SPHI|nr:Fe(3+) dicitrate transport protein [Parapedobacter koreensis]